ncbi:MAG: DUF3592 domain-containing protein [Pirellulales bacterium]|jgi:hypothetical protein|nr:DUF3592 domain-containing protein [Pirellulales bacterium]
MQAAIQAVRIVLYLILVSTAVLLILQVVTMVGELGNPDTQMKAIAVTCFQAGVTVSFTVALTLVGLKLMACRVKATGKILAIEVEHADSRRSHRRSNRSYIVRRLRYRAHVEFEHDHNPLHVYCLMGAAKYQKGDHVTIYYNPNNPRQARISLFKPVAILAIPLCLVVYFGWYIYDVGTEYWSEAAIEFAESMGEAARDSVRDQRDY